jgi:hypothetical protein
MLNPQGKYKGLAAMIAAQRSGTHMLDAAVGSHPACKSTGEIFCRRVPVTAKQMWKLIDRVKCGGFEVVFLDVKYNQISPPVEELLRHIPVIHLIRMDDGRLYYSRVLHTLKGEGKVGPGEFPTVEVDGRAFADIVAYRDNGICRFSHLEDLRLYYEDLTNNQEVDRLPDWACEKVCDVLGVERRVLTIGTLKDGPCSVDGLLV